MKKEVVIAIIVGFALGLIITFGIHTARQSINQRDTDSAQTETNSSTNTTTPEHQLTITSPTPSSVIDTLPLTVTGITTPHSLIAVLIPDDEFITTADERGNFSADINLEAGETILKVVSYAETGQSQERLVNVVYSTAQLEPKEAPPDES